MYRAIGSFFAVPHPFHKAEGGGGPVAPLGFLQRKLSGLGVVQINGIDPADVMAVKLNGLARFV